MKLTIALLFTLAALVVCASDARAQIAWYTVATPDDIRVRYIQSWDQPIEDAIADLDATNLHIYEGPPNASKTRVYFWINNRPDLPRHIGWVDMWREGGGLCTRSINRETVDPNPGGPSCLNSSDRRVQKMAIHINSAVVSGVIASDDYEISLHDAVQGTAAHELLHGVGLSHMPDCSDSIMRELIVDVGCGTIYLAGMTATDANHVDYIYP